MTEARHGRTGLLLVLAAALLGLSGFLLWTLVLDEPYLEPDLNAKVEQAVAVAVPALAGLVVARAALRRRQ
ncbi:hypothetical protein [Paractinoplanes maris]|uniref:hypothetical protein n=1 Tax=Paractinoplanes maris TaxID=1734446 RepID=UPI00202061CC|nr:hypothetical protein [Actinoplanes maris]